MTVQDDFLSYAAERAAEVIEGFKIEIVGDRVVMTPQSDVQSWTILDVQMAAMSSGIGKKRLLSDVLVRFPGEPPRMPDVTILEDGAESPYAYEDVLAAIEIVSSKDDGNDYDIKLRQYARFGIPVYLVIDPFRGECTLLTRPKGDTYAARETFGYGETIPLKLADGSSVDIPTDGFKRKS